jgi:hypothetical protein
LESNLSTAAREFQNLSNQITYMHKRLDDIKSEFEKETTILQDLREQAANLESFMYNYKNNDEEYVKIIKSIEDKVHDSLSDKKSFLKLAIFSLIESMRSNPDKYSSLVYHNNDNQSRYNSNLLDVKSSRQVILPPPPYDEYIIEDYKAITLEEAEKLYNVLIDQLVCEVVNENTAKQPVAALPLEGANKEEQQQQ